MKLQIDELGFVGINVEDWDINRSYRKPTITTDYNAGITYITRKNVPAGIPLTDNEYWKPIVRGTGSGGEQIQSDWNQNDSSKKDFIKNKPTIPAEQVQSDWNQSNSQAKDFIKNKPTIPAPTTIDPQPTKDSPNAVSSGGVYDVTYGTLKTRYIPFDLRGEAIIFLSNEDMTELFGPATTVGGQSIFDLTVGQYQHIYRVTNSKSEVFEISAAYHNANGARKIVGINGNLTIELSFTITNGVYINATIKKQETSIPGISYEEEQDLTAAQRRTAQQNIGLEKDVAGGVAGLNESGKLEATQMPTTVVQTENGKVPASVLPFGETSETAFAGNRGKALEQQMPQKQDVIQDLSTIRNNALYGPTSVQFGAAQQLTPTQQVNAQNNMMGKAYAPAQHSGLGKVYLAKNDGVLAQSMFVATDTVYVLQYAYTLSENITIPARCTLAFDGGSIKGNGSGKNTITGNNTTLIAQDDIFEAIKIEGSWNCPEIKSSFFKDEETVDVAKQLVKLSSDNIFNIITLGGNKVFQVNVDGEAFQSGLWLKSNTRLIIQGTLKTVPNNLDYCNTIICYCKENIEICGGGIIMGDKDQHTGSTGEFGMGVHVGSSRNVYIHDVEVQNCWGDGIQITCITGALGPSTFCSVRNCYIHNIRRNGIGIGYSSDVDVQNCEIADVSGTNPQAAIDIEPDGNNEYAKNISIRNVVSRNCLNGIEVLNIHTGGVIDHISIDSCRFVCNYMWALRTSNDITNINVSNSHFESTQYAKAVTLSTAGDIMFSGCSFKGKSTATGMLIENFDTDYNIYFYGCSFDAPKADVLQYASNVRMIGCNIVGDKLSSHSIRNTVIDSCTIDGVKFHSTAKSIVKITRCKMNINAQTYLQDASDIIISGNTIYITSTDAISFIYANRCRFLTVADNIINNVNDVSVGIILQACSYTRLYSNPVISSDGTTISEIGVNNIGNSTFNKQDSFLPIAGTTRPTGLSEGTMYYDTSLGKPIWYKGNNEWVDATGTVVS